MSMNLEKEYSDWLPSNKVVTTVKAYVDFIREFSKILSLNLFDSTVVSDPSLLNSFNESKRKLNADEKSKFNKFINFCSSKDLLIKEDFSFDTIKKRQSTEQKAIHHLSQFFQKYNAKIEDVSMDRKAKLGYDLNVDLNGIQYHIEVKGQENSKSQFILTANEYEKSITDDKYIFVLVRNCKSLQSKVDIRFFKNVDEKWQSVKYGNEGWISDKEFELEISPFQFLARFS